MLNSIIESIPISMFKTDTESYPKYELPKNYSFKFYEPGDERLWADIHVRAGEFKDFDKAIKCFTGAFVTNQSLNLSERMIFVLDDKGNAVATSALWCGIYLGKEHQRIHWVAVDNKCAGLGIAKAMLTKLLDLYNELGYRGFIYLTSGTVHYPAISIYRKFGFLDYRSRINPLSCENDEEYFKRNERAFEIINAKISEYKRG